MNSGVLLLAGLVVLLVYGVVRGLVVEGIPNKSSKAAAIQLSVYVLFVGFLATASGAVLTLDRFLRPYGWYRAGVLASLALVVVVALVMVLLWVRTSLKLPERKLTLSGPGRKNWYLVQVRSDFAKPTQDRVMCCGGDWDDVVRVLPGLARPRPPVPVNHIICLDGTWNDEESDTNVRRIFQLLAETCVNGEPQIKRYYAGVGIEQHEGLSAEVHGDTVSRGLTASITGLGERNIRWLAYLELVATYQPCDRICIFGFSRGASSARILANHIAKHGIPQMVQAKFQRAPLHKGKPIGPDKLRFLAVDGATHPVKIEMMGLWDTVAAFGLPSNKFEPFRKLSVPNTVKKAYHLVAVDERRWEFDATLIEPDDRVEEIWFAGAHTNVGGGSKDARLSDIALRFMINRALEHQICFAPDWESRLHGDVGGLAESLAWFWPLRATRRVGVNGQESKALPRIHKSVFERMKVVEKYDPPGIKRLDNAFICEVRD